MKLSQILHCRNKYHADPEYREKKRKATRQWQIEHKAYCDERRKESEKQLSEFANKKCVKCGKLLHYRNESKHCFKHRLVK